MGGRAGLGRGSRGKTEGKTEWLAPAQRLGRLIFAVQGRGGVGDVVRLAPESESSELNVL